MKNLFTFIAAVLLTANVFAQAPQKMSYQAVIRNSSNALVSSTAVGMRISILQTTASGTAVYVETQTPTTNANGLVSIEIGAGTAVTGTFAGIDWSAGPYFIKTETDPAGGSSYSITGTSQLLSVPYALSAAGIANPTGLVIPKLTSAQIQALPVSPATFGTIVYNTTANIFVGYRIRSVMSPFNYGNTSGSVNYSNPSTLAPSSSIKQTFNFPTSVSNLNISINANPSSGSVVTNGILTVKIYSGTPGSETLIATANSNVQSLMSPSQFTFYFNLSTVPSGPGYFTLETDGSASIRIINTNSDQISGTTQQAYDASGNLLSGKSWPFSANGTTFNNTSGWHAFQ